MTRDEARDLSAAALKASKADETFVTISAQDGEGLTFAAGTVLPGSALRDMTVSLSVRSGDHYGTAGGNRCTPDAMPALAAAALEAALRLPKAQAVLPYPGAADIATSPLTDTFTDADVAEWRKPLGELLALARQDSLLASGRMSVTRSSLAIASSNGLFAYQPWTQAHFQFRVTTGDGGSASFAEARSHRLRDTDPRSLAARAMRTALAWRNPIEVEPGRFTIVLAPEAVAELLLPVLRAFDQQAVDENRSMLRKLDGSSRIGSDFFAKSVTLRSDPLDEQIPSLPFTMDGLPLPASHWVRNGVPERATLTRFQAMQRKVQPVPFPSNLIMEGGSKTVDELVAGVKRGLFVHSFGPVTVEEPVEGRLVAATKDGVFLIQDGVIGRGVRNLTMRETAAHIFQMVDGLSNAVPVQPRNTYFPMRLPAMLVRDVMFAELSGLV